MNLLLSEAIMNSQYCQRLIVTHIRRFKRDQKFACVYLKIKPNQLSKGALHRKMMQYGIKLRTKHPSETNNNFKNSYLKSFFW